METAQIEECLYLEIWKELNWNILLYIPIQIPEIQTACSIYSSKKGRVYGRPGYVVYVIPIGFKTV